MSTTSRIDTLLRAACPIDIVTVNLVAHTASFVPSSSATPLQIAAATAVISGLDWSPVADAAWQQQQDRATAVSVFMTDRSVTAKVLRGLGFATLAQVNALYAALQTLRNDARAVAPSIPAVTYPQFSPADLGTAVQAQINTGAAD